jgi:hypothetical protein
MLLKESEPQESLRDFEYYTFECPACGDTERRLLPRGRVPITKILRTTTATPPPLAKPQDAIGRREDLAPRRSVPAGQSRSKPQDTIGKREDPALRRPHPLGPQRGRPQDTIRKLEDPALRREPPFGQKRAKPAEKSDDPNRINDVFKNPKKFIEMFVRKPGTGKD